MSHTNSEFYKNLRPSEQLANMAKEKLDALGGDTSHLKKQLDDALNPGPKTNVSDAFKIEDGLY